MSWQGGPPGGPQGCHRPPEAWLGGLRCRPRDSCCTGRLSPGDGVRAPAPRAATERPGTHGHGRRPPAPRCRGLQAQPAGPRLGARGHLPLTAQRDGPVKAAVRPRAGSLGAGRRLAVPGGPRGSVLGSPPTWPESARPPGVGWCGQWAVTGGAQGPHGMSSTHAMAWGASGFGVNGGGQSRDRPSSALGQARLPPATRPETLTRGSSARLSRGTSVLSPWSGGAQSQRAQAGRPEVPGVSCAVGASSLHP